MILIFVAVAGYSILFSDAIMKADDYSRYSLLVGVLVSVMLGIAFWYLQKIDSDNMQKILANQHEIIEKINARDNARKQFWVNGASAQIQSLIVSHETVIRAYCEFLGGKVSDKDEEEWFHHLSYLDYEAEEQILPRLLTALSNVADLLDDKQLINDIMLDDLTSSAKGRLMWHIETARIDLSAEIMRSTIPQIEEQIGKLQLLLSRLQKELPTTA
jgi:hypothetical protein